MKKDVLIIGSGLTGLLLGYRLTTAGYNVQILEARDRIGGRIHSLQSKETTPIEMGATWLGGQHQALVALLQELALPLFEQYMKGRALYAPLPNQPAQEIDIPPNESPSYRIQGGSATLIQKLASHLEENTIRLNTTVTQIEETVKGVRITSSDEVWDALYVVSTLPPNLFVNSIQCTPALPEELINLAKQTHTWMGESIKFGISYSQPFWRAKGYSGAFFSNQGPVTELYDHSNVEENRFALKGFLAPNLAQDTAVVRKEKVMSQLTNIFGSEAASYLTYEECVWRDETHTFIPPDNFLMPHQNNGHPFYQEAYFNNRLLIAGAETSARFGGYMEGAVLSAEFCFEQLHKNMMS